MVGDKSIRKSRDNMSSLKFCVLVIILSGVNAQRNFPDDICKTPDRQVGTCVSIYSCKPIMEILDKVSRPNPAVVTDLLKAYHCGFSGRQPMMCCPSKPIFVEGITPKSSDDVPPPPPPDVSNHKKIKLLPENCGILDTGDKILHGSKTGPLEFPWMALLSYGTNRGAEYKCGASIINNRYILTAAHCVSELKEPLLRVRVGDHNYKTEKDCYFTRERKRVCAPPYKDLAIEEITPHPEYNSKLHINDIALLRVTPMDFTQENIKPVCLPLERTRTYNFTNRNSMVAGWGLTQPVSTVFSPELLKAYIPTVPQEKCVDIFKKVTAINYRQLCAGGGYTDTCSGDSGGPLQVVAYLNGDTRMVQQGIVSFGPIRCGGTQGVPGVYTRVAYFMDWILDTMKP